MFSADAGLDRLFGAFAGTKEEMLGETKTKAPNRRRETPRNKRDSSSLKFAPNPYLSARR
jgi:hypothetical protein